jgi:hypothetical protein
MRRRPFPGSATRHTNRLSLNCCPDFRTLFYPAGVDESRGRIGGLLLERADGLVLAKYRGTSQSKLSKMVRSPQKAPNVAPAILCLSVFVVMAFAGRRKLSWMMGSLSVVYVLLLPEYIVGALLCSFLVHAKKFRAWDQKFICQRCGATIRSLAATSAWRLQVRRMLLGPPGFCFPDRSTRKEFDEENRAQKPSLLLRPALLVWFEVRVTRVSVQKSARVHKVNPLEHD